MIVSPAATGARSPDTSEVISLAAVLGQIVKIFVVVDSVDLILRHRGDMLDILRHPSAVLIVIPSVERLDPVSSLTST